MDKILFSSEKMDWETPPDFFKKLHEEFNFDIDVCATKENAKVPNYISKEKDAFIYPWHGRAFMNPPYGKEIGEWIWRAWHNCITGDCDLVVCLVPARTDTKYWHNYCMKANEIRFIKGRLRFYDKGEPAKSKATFPSALVIFNKRKTRLVVKGYEQ